MAHRRATDVPPKIAAERNARPHAWTKARPRDRTRGVRSHERLALRAQEIGFGVRENLENRFTIFFREVSEIRARILAGQHLAQTRIDAILDDRRQRVEPFGINQIAERILEEAMLEIEVAQRAALAIARASCRKISGERRGAFHRRSETC